MGLPLVGSPIFWERTDDSAKLFHERSPNAQHDHPLFTATKRKNVNKRTNKSLDTKINL